MILKSILWCLLLALLPNSDATPMADRHTTTITSHKFLEMIRPHYLKTGDTVAIVAPRGKSLSNSYSAVSLLEGVKSMVGTNTCLYVVASRNNTPNI